MSAVTFFFFFQAEDGIRDLVRSRGLGDVYKRQVPQLSLRHDFLWLAARRLADGAADDLCHHPHLCLSLIHI